MEYVVIAFRSRQETVAFSGFLKRNGLSCEIVNTPKEAGVGCGLSVKISKNLFSFVKNAVFTSGLKSFAGFFLVTRSASKNIVRSI